MLNKFCLKGKYALITGATGLLGREHCFALAEIKSNLIITDLDKPSLIELRQEILSEYPNISVHFLTLDISKESAVVDVIDYIRDKVGRLDVLINNAAVNPTVSSDKLKNTSRLESFDLEEWDHQVSVGLTGAFLCIKHFGFLMHGYDNGGVILNIASDLSVIAPDQRLYDDTQLPKHLQSVKPVTYSVIKTGLIGLTRYVASYWNESKIRCNALSPGGVYVDQPEEFVRRLSSLIPLGRMANKNEYQSAVQFLCSDASSYVTGQNIVIDGGRTVW